MKISLDIQLCYDLREAINEEQHISSLKPLKAKKANQMTAWDRICAIMDRLKDTVDYINDLELNTGIHENSAFDFYDFMNTASVILDCIELLAEQFDYNLDHVDKTCLIFNQPGKDGKGSDKRYFEYLRSICSVHPIKTDRHACYQDSSFECCPFVTWHNERLSKYVEGDLFALIYSSIPGTNNKSIYIKMSEIFSYLTVKYNTIPDIVKNIEIYHQSIITEFKKKIILTTTDFSNYIEYLDNLIMETEERFNDSSLNILQYAREIITCGMSNSANYELYNRYCEALKYAISFQHNALQNMSYDGYLNNGLIYIDKNIETSLMNLLYDLRNNRSDVNNLGYALEKIIYLSYDSGCSNKSWAHIQIKRIKPFLDKYVSIDGASSDFEYYALVHLALYQDCLEHDCSLNRNLPNDLAFRIKLLRDDELIINGE